MPRVKRRGSIQSQKKPRSEQDQKNADLLINGLVVISQMLTTYVCIIFSDGVILQILVLPSTVQRPETTIQIHLARSELPDPQITDDKVKKNQTVNTSHDKVCVCNYVCMYVCMYVPPIYLSIYLFIYLSLSIHLSIYPIKNFTRKSPRKQSSPCSGPKLASNADIEPVPEPIRYELNRSLDQRTRGARRKKKQKTIT